MYKLFCLLWDWVKQVPWLLCFPSHHLYVLSIDFINSPGQKLGLMCLAQDELNPFKYYLNINNSNKLLAAGCWYTQAAALPCWIVLSPWLLEAAPWSPILEQAQSRSLLSVCVQCPGLEPICQRQRSDGFSFDTKRPKLQAKGGFNGCEGSIATNTAEAFWCGLRAIIPGRWVSSCSLGPRMPKPGGRWGLFNRKTGSLVCCRVHCSHLWQGLGSAPENVVHFRTECSPASFSLGLSDVISPHIFQMAFGIWRQEVHWTMWFCWN